MSLWLATHLTDLLEKLNLVDDDDDETYELPLRDYFVIQYTDMLLLGHEGYWEIVCDYLSGCGAQGVGRIREILRRISLDLGSPLPVIQADNNQDAVMDDGSVIGTLEGNTNSIDDLETVNALLKVASDHGLEDERREICRASFACTSRYKGRATELTRPFPGIAGCPAITTASEIRPGVGILYTLDGHASLGGDRGSGTRRVLFGRYVRCGRFGSRREADDGDTCVQGPMPICRLYKRYRPRSSQATMADSELRELPCRCGVLMLSDRCYSNVLLFLARFKEFHDAFADGRKPDAAKIILACFGEGLVPEGFMAVLLIDTVALLQGELSPSYYADFG
jgi:hypothetical protein